MISNREFIKTQAYEISWAVFRCAELFSQTKLRGEVEAAAVDLAAGYDMINEATEADVPRIEKLTTLIRLAESVGQIAAVNASVLYRELDHLATAIRLEVATQREKKNITASLERIFTNSAYAKNLSFPLGHPELAEGYAADSSTPRSTTALGTTKSDNPAIPQNENRKSETTAQVPSNPLEQFIQQPNRIVRQSSAVVAGMQYGSGDIIADLAIAAAVPTIQKPIRQAAQAQGSWQRVILQKVKTLGQTTTKELTASFPEISERTIRFYLQKLVDNGSIDRIGSTGPGSAYRAK